MTAKKNQQKALRAAHAEDDTTPFSVDGHDFSGVREAGFTESGAFVISAWTTPPPIPRGSYFTCIPISGAEYRKTHPTRAAFAREPCRICVLNDWGQTTTIDAPQGVIDDIVQGCIENGLPEIASACPTGGEAGPPRKPPEQEP